jgi:PAS domain S-box-containing protein
MVAVAACCNFFLPPVYGESHYFFFSAAVLASSLFGGLGPGLLATSASALSSAYLFIVPFHSFQVEAPEAAERLAMFVIEGAIVSSVGRVIRDNRTPELASPLRRYAAAVILVAGATILKLIFFPTLERHLPFTFFYSAIVATAWVAGVGPGLVASAISAVSVYYFFSLAPSAAAPGNPGVALFGLEAMAICLLTGSFRQRLVETEAHLGRVFEDSPLGILIIEQGSQILKANPAFRQFLRLDERERPDERKLEGRPVRDLVHPDFQERVQAFLEHLILQQSVAVVEEVCIPRGSSVARANLYGSWIHEGLERSQTCLVMVEDITERLKAEEALRETEARLLRAQKMETIGMLVGGVAHDFNNLLSVIFGACERMLYDKSLPAEARESVEEIFQTAKTAAELIRQLLTFARRKPRTDQVVEVNQLVTETASLLNRMIGSQIELETVFATESGTVRADPCQLQQVLMNLATNARDAMPSGGRLTIRTSRTSVAAARRPDARAGQYVTVEVADTGQGMDEATRARIFEPLFTTKGLDHGTGLGLATVHSIVKKLGGHIRVQSALGEGTCFWIHLPAADRESEGPPETVAGHLGAGAH